MTETTINPEVAFKAGVELILENLADDELATLYNSATWDDGETRSRLEKRPWFLKVESFFTEKGGKDLHPATLEAMTPVVEKRLTRQG